jgi:hypothetical protein
MKSVIEMEGWGLKIKRKRKCWKIPEKNPIKKNPNPKSIKSKYHFGLALDFLRPSSPYVTVVQKLAYQIVLCKNIEKVINFQLFMIFLFNVF